MPSRTKLILLGTGTPNLEHDRYQSAHLIVVDQTPYLIDCGGGALHRLTEARARFRSCHPDDLKCKNTHGHWSKALSLEQLQHVFLTHLHPDHTAGLPGMMWTKSMLAHNNRTSKKNHHSGNTTTVPVESSQHFELHIHGPNGTQIMVQGIDKAFNMGGDGGFGRRRGGTTSCFSIIPHEIQPGVVYQDDLVKVTALGVQHVGLDALGFRFDTPDKIIVISGDTTYMPIMAEHARHADILVHEVYSAQQWHVIPADWQTYHIAAHTSTTQVAAVARDAQPKLLVLVHELLWGTTLEGLLAETQQHYDGPVVCGRDLDLFE